MVIAKKGDCKEYQDEKNEAIEKFVARRVREAFEDEGVREIFKDLLLYFKKSIYGENCRLCCDLLFWKEDLGVIFIEVKAWDKNFISKNWNRIVSEEKRNPYAQIKGYVNCVLSLGIKPVSGVLAFPLLSYKDIENLPESPKTFFEKNEEEILFKEDFQSNELLRKKILKGVYFHHEKIPLEKIKANMEKFRRLFFPELEVPWKGNVLDYLQEEASYALTRPPKRKNLKERDCNVISGCSGTGKSVIVVSATIRQALEWYLKGDKDRKIQILVYNRSFLDKMKEDIEYVIKSRKLPRELLNYINMSTIHFLATQILKMHGIDRREGEDNVDKLSDLLETGKIKIPEELKPDVLLVDESQDIRRKWFKFIHSLLKPETVVGFAIDKVQRIYEDTDWTWKEVGFNAVGRSKVLKRIYRSASEIFSLGLEFLKRDKEYFKELSKLEGSWLKEKLETVKGKGKVRVLHSENRNSFDDVIKILEILLKRYDAKDIMIIEFFSKKAERLVKTLKFHPGLSPYLDKLTITTFHSAKGLEKKAVIIQDFDKLFHKVRNKKEERRRRSLGFVAITRAEEELYFVGNAKEGALKEIVEILKENSSVHM